MIVERIYRWFADPGVPDERTWLGHSLVWVGLIARGLLFGALAAWVIAPISIASGAAIGASVGFLDGGIYYGNREFGPAGDYWGKSPADSEGRNDSKMDLWLPLIVAAAVLGATLGGLL